MPNINESIYEALLKATYPVFLTRDGETIATPLMCRNLPFTTLSTILGEIAVSAKSELQDARRRLLEDIVNSGAINVNADQVIDIIMPLLSTVVYESPRLAKRVLMDVCIDMTEDKVLLLSVEDVVSIMDEVIKRLDVQRVAEKAKSIFTQATEIFAKTLELQVNKDAALERAQKLPSQKA